MNSTVQSPTQRTTSRGSSKLPPGYLFYSRVPNSEEVPWEEATTWEEAQLWGGWALTLNCHAVVGNGFWFTNSTTPLTKLGSEIQGLAGINTATVLFSTSKGLAVYPVGTSAATLNKAKKFLKIT